MNTDRGFWGDKPGFDVFDILHPVTVLYEWVVFIHKQTSGWIGWLPMLLAWGLIIRFVVLASGREILSRMFNKWGASALAGAVLAFVSLYPLAALCVLTVGLPGYMFTAWGIRGLPFSQYWPWWMCVIDVEGLLMILPVPVVGAIAGAITCAVRRRRQAGGSSPRA